MDFLEIILEGYFHVGSRSNLKNYFIRKFQKAQKEDFYSCNEFFDGLLTASNALGIGVAITISSQETELKDLLETGDKNIIAETKRKLEQLKNPDYLVTLPSTLFSFTIHGEDMHIPIAFSFKQISENGCYLILSQIEQAKNSVCNENGKQIKGFQSKLTDNKIKSLHEQMQGIYFNTDYKNFEAMLTGKECYTISWKHKNPKGGVNQTSLVAFIETILKQTKKVAKTHFGIEVKSINRDAYYKHYVTKYKTIIE